MAERIRCNWVASLGDGTTRTEEAYLLANLPAYGTLLQELKDKGVKMTGFRLQRAGLTHTAPSGSPHAKFPSNVPFELGHHRRAAQDLSGGEEWYCNYVVKVGELTIKLWIDEKTGDSWLQLLGGTDGK